MNSFLIKKIEKFVDIFLQSRSFRNYICDRSKKLATCKKTFKYVGTENAYFINDDMILTIEQTINDYIFYDLRPTDIVLDIGTCIGGFTLNINKKVKHVYAVEPIMTERLRENIELNNSKNITVFECGLGSGEQELEWNGTKKIIKCYTLSELIKMCGGHIDFLKCDCEGNEIRIRSEELSGIRRLEMEVHCPQKEFVKFCNMLNDAGFEYTSSSEPSLHLHLVHARRK
jgi:FkbM family methyltransferase